MERGQYPILNVGFFAPDGLFRPQTRGGGVTSPCFPGASGAGTNQVNDQTRVAILATLAFKKARQARDVRSQSACDPKPWTLDPDADGPCADGRLASDPYSTRPNTEHRALKGVLKGGIYVVI